MKLAFIGVMSLRGWWSIVLVFILFGFPLLNAEQELKGKGPEVLLDSLIKAPECWSLTPEQLETGFHERKDFRFVWLTKDRTRAKLSRYRFSNVQIQLSLFEKAIPIDEVTVDFENGKMSVVSFSLFSRGDSARISPEDFDERFLLCGQKIGKLLEAKPQSRKADPKQGMPIAGFFWESKKGLALLTHNEGARKGEETPAFLRLRLANPYGKGPLVQAMRNKRGGCAVKLSQLKGRVTRDQDGNVFIPSLPMVDQGSKGYCVVASAQRVFEYYGVGIDMHQIAEIAGSDPSKGTSSYQMARELDEIDYRFKTRLEVCAMMSTRKKLAKIKQSSKGYRVGDDVELDDFAKDVKDSIDEGVPLLWALELGLFPETPNLTPQTGGGHMRTIIGYNDAEQLVVFSDSWGAGHEFKTMSFEHAYKATTGLFRLKPIVN